MYNHKGKDNPNWRNGSSLKHCQCGNKISFYSKNCRKCYLKINKGKNSTNWKGGLPYCKCGKKLSDRKCKRCLSCDTKRKIKLGIIGFKTEEKHYNWRGGISKEPYSFAFTEKLKERIRQRDKYVCQNCSKIQKQELIEIKRKLSIHHIDYDKNNCKKNNLVSLCYSCNTKANFNRDYWHKFYQAKIEKKSHIEMI